MKNIFMRFPNGLKKVVTLSYDDGVEQDETLLNIMNEYGLKGTFNVNSGLYKAKDVVYKKGEIHRRMSKEQVFELFSNSGQEIAVHTKTHPMLTKIATHVGIKEVLDDKESLEEQFGIIVRGMAYPFGVYDDAVVAYLKLCDIAYARTTNSTHTFYFPTEWLLWNPTCHHRDGELDTLVEKFLKEQPTRDPLLFYLWGHSYEFERDDNWEVIENFAKAIGRKDDIWYATNIEIFDYVTAFNQLIFSTDGTLVKNPTSSVIWLEYNDSIIKLESGETKKL